MARGNGEGSIRYLAASNRYQYRISYKDKDGNTRRKSFYASKAADARKKGREWLSFYESSNKSADINPMLDDWIRIWLDVYMKNSVRPSTLEKYVCCLDPVGKAFKGIRLNKLNPTALQQFFQQQLFSGGRKKQGLAPVTVRNQRRYLTSCIDMAIKLGLTNSNPAKLTMPPKVEKKEIHPLSELEVQRLLDVAKDQVEKAKASTNIVD